jgi:hypothetical protein
MVICYDMPTSDREINRRHRYLDADHVGSAVGELRMHGGATADLAIAKRQALVRSD